MKCIKKSDMHQVPTVRDWKGEPTIEKTKSKTQRSPTNVAKEKKRKERTLVD